VVPDAKHDTAGCAAADSSRWFDADWDYLKNVPLHRRILEAWDAIEDPGVAVG